MCKRISMNFIKIAVNEKRPVFKLYEWGVSIKTLIKVLGLVLFFSVLSSCSNNSITPTEIIVSTKPVDTIDYYLPVEDYSSERTEEITHIVIHFMSAVVDHPDDPHNTDYIRRIFLEHKTSPHYMIDREGTVYPCIPEARTAWHAGKGTWGEITDSMNSRSIGIELLGIGTFEEMSQYLTKNDYKKIDPAHIGFTNEQYISLDLLLNDIFSRNPGIVKNRNHVIGHAEYSPRKTDPGTLFDWNNLSFTKD